MPNFSFSQRNNAYIEMPVSQRDLTQRMFVYISFGMHSGLPAKIFIIVCKVIFL